LVDLGTPISMMIDRDWSLCDGKGRACGTV